MCMFVCVFVCGGFVFLFCGGFCGGGVVSLCISDYAYECVCVCVCMFLLKQGVSKHDPNVQFMFFSRPPLP